MPTSFSERINELMSEHQYSKRTLADELGYHYSTIVQYCAGTRSPSGARMEELAEFFDCDVDYLMGRSDVRRVLDLEFVIDERITGKDIEILTALKKADPKIRSAIMILLGLKAAR
jgi:transcriptional regulator with XRE-family HTH domain